MAEPKHPDQPIVMVNGVARFKANPIVQHLLEHGGIDLNDLARLKFSDEDRAHFAQLIGYSVSGWGGLPYVAEEDADAQQAKVMALLGLSLRVALVAHPRLPPHRHRLAGAGHRPLDGAGRWAAEVARLQLGPVTVSAEGDDYRATAGGRTGAGPGPEEALAGLLRAK